MRLGNKKKIRRKERRKRRNVLGEERKGGKEKQLCWKYLPINLIRIKRLLNCISALCLLDNGTFFFKGKEVHNV